MEVKKHSSPIPIPKKKKKNKQNNSNDIRFQLGSDNNFISNSPPSNNKSKFLDLLKYKISPSSFKKYSINEYAKSF